MPASATSLYSSRHLSKVMRWVACGLLVAMPVLADVATGIGKKEKDRKDDKNDKKRESEYLPEARPVTARFVAGQSVTIELSAAVSSQKAIEFIVRQAPQHGQITAPQPHATDPSRTVVTYIHSSPEAPLADSFTFACRVVGGSWSAPATVSLVGQRMEPRLEIVESPSFGRVFVGGEKIGKVIVRNRGTAPMQGALSWQEPWSGPPTFEVPMGGVTEFFVKFQPKKSGEYRQDLVLQPGLQSSRIILYADCVLPFSISPSKLEMAFVPTTGERSGIFSLVNARTERVKASLALPPWLQGPTSLELAPGSKTDVRVWLPEGRVEAFAGKISVMAGESSASIFLEAKPVPAAMSLLAPGAEGLDFGRVYQKEASFKEVTVANRGGEVLVMEIRADTPFSIEGVRDAVRIEPQQKHTFKVSLHADRTGLQTSQVELTSGAGKVRVPLRVEVLEPKAAPLPVVVVPISMTKPKAVAQPAPVLAVASPRSAPAAQTAPAPAVGDVDEELKMPERNTMQAAILTLLSTHGLPIPKGSINPYLDPVKEVAVLERNTSNMTVSWKKPAVMPSGWVVEFANLIYQRELNSYTKVWTRFPHWQPVDAGPEQVGIRLNGLRPAGQYEMRIMGVDRDGKFSKPSDAVMLRTSNPWRVPAWAWRLMIVGALSLIAYVLFRVRRGDFMVEA